MKTRLALVLFLLFGLVGCSSLKLGYNHADWLIYRQVDRHMDLKGPQKDRAKALIAQLVTWHAQEELPPTLDFLSQVQKTAGGPLSQPVLLALHQAYFERWQVLVRHFLPPVASLLAGLSPEQRLHLIQALEEENQEIAEEVAQSPAKRAKEWREAFVDGFEEWLGSLTPAQEALVVDLAQSLPQDGKEHRLARRRAQQKAFFERFPSFAGQEPAILAFLEEEWLKPISPRQAKLRDQWIDFLLAFAPTTSPAQRQHFQAKLGSVIQDLQGFAPLRPRLSTPQD